MDRAYLVAWLFAKKIIEGMTERTRGRERRTIRVLTVTRNIKWLDESRFIDEL